MITAEQFILKANKNKAQTQGLIDTANETTQQNDTTLTDAVNHLKEGYGQGGGDVNAVVDVLSPAVQQNGARTNFDDLFNNSNIDDATVSRLLDNWTSTIKVSNKMFRNTKKITNGLYHDKLDLSQSASLNSAFGNSTVTKLKKIDARATVIGWNGMASICSNCPNLTQIDEFYPSADPKCKFDNTFYGCVNLVKLIFKSVISQDGLDLSACTKLSRESIESVVEQLSTTTSGLTVTLSQAAIDRISNEEEGGEYLWFWLLTDTRQNWTVELK